MNILQEIFTDHYEEIKYTLHPRPAEMENIDKMINCGDPSYGGAMYGCIHCGNLKFVPFRCHSRFFPTCGNKYSMDRTTSMSFKLVNVRHRHCVFTIDASLRDFFLQDRSLLNCLFHSVSSVVLRNAFRTALLKEMLLRIGPSFKKVSARCYLEHEHGFYVYAKPNRCDPKTVTKYIGRYLGRPVIATSRVDSYTGDLVSFHYNRHEDDQYVQETIPVMDFIKRLIRHIPEKHFKMIRYGGLYARHRSIDKKLHLAISKEKRHTFRCFNRWRTAILSSFGYDPLICPHCKQQMVILEIYHNHRRVPLEELYEKAMSRSRGKRSSA